MPSRTARVWRYERPMSARVRLGTQALPDSSERFIPALEWLGGDGRDPLKTAEQRAELLLRSNAGVFREMGVEIVPSQRHGQPGLLARTSTRVGAIPLLSPITGRPDFGLTVEPRFAWSSAGDMLAGTGFRVVPELLPLPDLPQSERRIPPWVLSSVILTRLLLLLDQLQRRFVMTHQTLPAPRGQVDWTTYATCRMPTGQLLDVPCRFPDLQEDAELRAGIHWVVRHHRESLLTQRSAGRVVSQLLALCELLIARLAGTPPRRPSPRARTQWEQRPLLTRVFREGLQAIDWTVDARGLAGLSDLAGLPWRMEMERFFEAWVEAIAAKAASQMGAIIHAGRREETRVPLDWHPPASGSQRSLLPDVVLKTADVTIILEAKYKRHAHEIEQLGWKSVDQQLREQHRNDVLQALAYAALFDTPRTVACLVYPAEPTHWRELVRRKRELHRARVRTGSRCIELALLAIPLSGDLIEAGASLRTLACQTA